MLSVDNLKDGTIRSMRFLKKKVHTTFFGQCAVLLYHRVTELETDPQLLAVSPGNFNDHLIHLKENYNLLSIAEFKNILFNGKRFPDRSVLLTFDDGYADNFLEALPLIEKHHTQAIFYITTSNLNTTNELWWDEIERILLLTSDLPATLETRFGNGKMVFNTSDLTERKITYDLILPLLRIQTPVLRKEIVSELVDWSGNNKQRQSHRLMTFRELQLFSSSESVVIGAHTHNHQSLASLSRREQAEEISKSKNILEEETGKKIMDFSYPFGTKKDYNRDTINICREIGFEMVTANYPYIANKRSNRFEIPRFLIRDWNKDVFAENMKQFLR